MGFIVHPVTDIKMASMFDQFGKSVVFGAAVALGSWGSSVLVSFPDERSIRSALVSGCAATIAMFAIRMFKLKRGGPNS